jgi:hypothetical protein
MESGIRKVEANLKDQLVLVEGTTAPSRIVAAIQGTGRDAILRGSGTSNSMPSLVLDHGGGTFVNEHTPMSRCSGVHIRNTFDCGAEPDSWACQDGSGFPKLVDRRSYS